MKFSSINRTPQILLPQKVNQLAKRLSVRLAVVLLNSAFFIMACAPVKFEKNEQATCQGFKESCTPVIIDNVTYQEFNYPYTVSGRTVDILVVNDNSGSMSFEQNHMAERFGTFLQALEQRQIDYRIAITTTDVSDNNPSSSLYNPPRAINKNGALQDGKLIAYADGSFYLTPATANKQSLFEQAVKRSETLQCESFLKTNQFGTGAFQTGYKENCPSGNERGIFAINQVIKNNPNGFVRANSHLAVVVLSDEDEVSGLYQSDSGFNTYKLDTEDMPHSVIDNAKKYLGSNTISVHSILVYPGVLISGNTPTVAENISRTVLVNTKPITSALFSGGDTACLNSQNNQTPTINGGMGYLYSLLSKMTGGTEGNICSSDYGAQLYDIGMNASSHVNEIKLACAQPKDLKVVLDANNTGAQYSVNSDVLKFDRDLFPGSKIQLSYLCPK